MINLHMVFGQCKEEGASAGACS